MAFSDLTDRLRGRNFVTIKVGDSDRNHRKLRFSNLNEDSRRLVEEYYQTRDARVRHSIAIELASVHNSDNNYVAVRLKYNEVIFTTS